MPLPEVVVDAVRTHLRQFPIAHPDRLMFTDEDGRALRRTAFSRAYAHIWPDSEDRTREAVDSVLALMATKSDNGPSTD